MERRLQLSIEHQPIFRHGFVWLPSQWRIGGTEFIRRPRSSSISCGAFAKLFAGGSSPARSTSVYYCTEYCTSYCTSYCCGRFAKAQVGDHLRPLRLSAVPLAVAILVRRWLLDGWMDPCRPHFDCSLPWHRQTGRDKYKYCTCIRRQVCVVGTEYACRMVSTGLVLYQLKL
jgi:hypothetical protein